MQRMGMVIGIKPEKIAEYKELHANCWPEILKGIEESNIRNYSIWLHEGEQRLFGYWEYHGDDFAADMQKMADDPITKKWWACLLYTSPSPRDVEESRMPSSA